MGVQKVSLYIQWSGYQYLLFLTFHTAHIFFSPNTATNRSRTIIGYSIYLSACLSDCVFSALVQLRDKMDPYILYHWNHLGREWIHMSKQNVSHFGFIMLLPPLLCHLWTTPNAYCWSDCWWWWLMIIYIADQIVDGDGWW